MDTSSPATLSPNFSPPQPSVLAASEEQTIAPTPPFELLPEYEIKPDEPLHGGALSRLLRRLRKLAPKR